MDGVLFGILAGAVLLFIINKAVKMRKSKASGGSSNGGGSTGVPQEDQNNEK